MLLKTEPDQFEGSRSFQSLSYLDESGVKRVSRRVGSKQSRLNFIALGSVNQAPWEGKPKVTVIKY